jgi:hypothetical protein
MIAKILVTLANTVLHPTSAKGRQQKLAWSASGARG